MTSSARSALEKKAREAGEGTSAFTDAGLEQLADLVASRLVAAGGRRALVDVRAIAAYLSVDPSWVYAHASELGARRLGSGPKAPLRFSLDEVDEALRLCLPCSESKPTVSASGAGSRRRRRVGSGTTVELLPVRGSVRPDSDARAA